MHNCVCVRVGRKMALPAVTSCFRTRAAAANVLVASLRTWVPIDLGGKGGGGLQATPKSVNSFFLFFSCRRASCPAVGPRPEGCCGLPALQPRRPPPRRPARLATELPPRHKKGEAKGWGALGRVPAGSPAAKLVALPAAAARVAPRAVRGCAAGQSLRGPGGAPRSARP